MTTEQLAPPILHARFKHGVLLWELRRGDTVDRNGAYPSAKRDPLAELRGLECRIGAATVHLSSAGLTLPEQTYAKGRGWTLV